MKSKLITTLIVTLFTAGCAEGDNVEPSKKPVTKKPVKAKKPRYRYVRYVGLIPNNKGWVTRAYKAHRLRENYSNGHWTLYTSQGRIVWKGSLIYQFRTVQDDPPSWYRMKRAD